MTKALIIPTRKVKKRTTYSDYGGATPPLIIYRKTESTTQETEAETEQTETTDDTAEVRMRICRMLYRVNFNL